MLNSIERSFPSGHFKYFDVDCVKIQFEDNHSIETHNNENILPVPPKRNEPCRFVFGDHLKTKGIVKDIQWDQKGYLVLSIGGINSLQSVVKIDTKKNSVKKIGNLSIGKQYHCSEKIGNDVFVLGDKCSKKIEKYNLESNKSEVLSLGMTRNKDFYSSVVHSNRIHVIGGILNDNSIDTVEYFEPEKIKWIDAPQLLQSIRCHDSVIVDEIIYTVGDILSNKLQRFDPREGKWSFLADIPNKTHYTVLSVFEHTITCSGGGNTQSLCQVYDIRNDEWDKLSNLTIPVSGARSIENKTSIIIAGGGNTRSLCQIYDITNNKWDKLENLTIPVYGAKSVENETSIIVAGGHNIDQIQSYNKNNKTWSIMDITLPYKIGFSSKIWL
uniref:Kelch repeat protein n=1 Tax=Rhabditophanes sp. KR3021 TaxID=114890 RepID=A0AC35UFT4_9BILA